MPMTRPTVDAHAILTDAHIAALTGAFEHWIHANVSGGHPHPDTVRLYLSDARQFLRWAQARRLSLAAITAETLNRYLSWLAQDTTAEEQLYAN